MSNSDKLERAEEEIFRIGEAIEQLERVRGMEDVTSSKIRFFTNLKDREL